MTIRVKLDPLETTEYFPYLDLKVAFNNRDQEALYGNRRKASRRWVMVTKVITNTGSTVREWAMMYKEVIQKVLIYGSKSWVLTEAILKALEVFHHWEAQIISGMSAW